MSRIAYFVKSPERENRQAYDSFLKELFARHPLAFCLSTRTSRETERFFESEKVTSLSLEEALRQNIVALPEEGVEDLFLLKEVRERFNDDRSTPLVLSVSFKDGLSSPYRGDIVMWHSFLRVSHGNRGVAWAVAHYQSFGFRVMDINGLEMRPEILYPEEDIKIHGKGVVGNNVPDYGGSSREYAREYSVPESFFSTSKAFGRPLRLLPRVENLVDTGSHFKGGKKKPGSIY